MQVRPTIMASALLNAALKSPASETGKKVLYHAITDDPKQPFKSGYNRSITNNVRVSQSTLSKVYG